MVSVYNSVVYTCTKRGQLYNFQLYKHNTLMWVAQTMCWICTFECYKYRIVTIKCKLWHDHYPLIPPSLVLWNSGGCGYGRPDDLIPTSTIIISDKWRNMAVHLISVMMIECWWMVFKSTIEQQQNIISLNVEIWGNKPCLEPRCPAQWDLQQQSQITQGNGIPQYYLSHYL